MKKGISLMVFLTFVLSLIACQFTPTLDLGLLNQKATQVVATVQAAPGAQKMAPESTTLSTDAALTSIYERVNPGVVTIISTSDQGSSSGSGFVYDAEGYILTNYHVVEGSKTVEVDFPSGLKVNGAVEAVDIDSDIALIKVSVPSAELVPLPLGNSDTLKVGQMVVAIGNPFRLSSTMTLGIVSAKGRILDSLRTAADQSVFTAGDIIQTDAAINPGNSGGPLLNLQGEVIGINRAIRTTGTTAQGDPINSGIGFAISINIVKHVVPFLIQDGKYDYPYLGISSPPQDLLLAEWKALNISRTSGAYISTVTAGGPAEAAGLKGGSQPTNIMRLDAGGDLIIAVDDKPVNIYGDLISYIFANKVPGEKITLSIIRQDKPMEVTITLGKRP
ncbi:MAG: trypsin-like peptidase domain-containing protein [Chloroflexi bacterium]|nr:trypsin-like peptidase domain-containing protein [Chloroflexota bacterium]